MKIGELFVFLGVKVDDKQLKNFDTNLKGLSTQLDLTKVGAIAALYAIDRFIESSVAGAVALYNFTQQTGNSAQALQQWQAAAHAANPALGIDQIAQSIQTLENNLVEIRKFGAGNASPFAWLQIDIAHGQNAIDVLEQLRDRVQGLDRVTAVNLIQKMGLNPGFINILTRSKEEFDALVKSMLRNDGTINTLEKLGERIAALKLKITLFKDNMVADFAPAITAIINAIYSLGSAFSHAYSAIKEFAQESPDLFKGIGASIAALLVVLNPLKSLILGIILLLDDLYVYKKGGQSVFGSVYESIGDTFDKIKSGELKKNYNRYDKLSSSSEMDNSINVTNNINMGVTGDAKRERYSIATESIDELNDEIWKSARQAQKNMNYGFTDQQYKGSGF
jgi:hypothetical protein